VTQVRFAGRQVDRQSRRPQFVMRPTHATSRRCLATLLYSHFTLH
jgi:hypothetical protein